MGFLVVGHGSTITSGGRRLLSDVEDNSSETLEFRLLEFGDDWSHISSPCSDLALAVLDPASSKSRGTLGIMDHLTLENCIRWRFIGNQSIQDLNLTALMPPGKNNHFLLSIRDFASVVRGKRDVLLQFMQIAPRGIRYMLEKSNRGGALTDIAKSLAEIYARYSGEKELIAKAAKDAIDSIKNTSAVNLITKEGVETLLEPFLHEQKQQQQLPTTTGRRSVVVDKPKTVSIDPITTRAHKLYSGLRKINSSQTESTPKETSARKLLQTLTQQQQREAIQGFSSLTAFLGGSSSSYGVPLADIVADAWIDGPVAWPPRYGQEPGYSCSIYEKTKDSLIISSLVLVKYYTSHDRFSPPPNLTWDIISSFPKIYTGENSTSSSTTNFQSRTPTSEGGLMESFYTYFADSVVVSWLGITPSGIAAFMSSGRGVDPDKYLTLGGMIRETLICDFEATIMCSRHNRNIFTSFVVSLLIFWAIQIALNFIGIGGITLVGLAVVPGMAMWLAYGVSPACLPMFPTCLVEDIIQVFKVVLPSTILWPQALQVYPDCLGQAGQIPINATLPIGSPECMRSCRGDPFYFRSWESSIAWVVCGFDPLGCTDFLTSQYFPLLQTAATNITTVLSNGDTDTINAFSFCFWVTIAQAVPVVFIAIAGSYTLVAFIRVPFIVAGAAVQSALQALAYTHVRKQEQI